ncbi:MBL fold metallo-hydrolase [Helicobacter didelphidarum]|uniref:MBL fold metallo-hydrolase n=1 Tax=Helicobacter didelphidarum TaxID=2040648 RepID=A0A3D8IN74_9HELI|nr:MBL fold metallo-hydrolase [Helicobacter didelphidarum]RDU66021.1 MBL fold metallo-hydrolase [Helicobacter didelphidarum]
MEIQKKASGDYQTNTYILHFNSPNTIDFAIDPSFANDWVFNNTSNLKAIFITHGHFDHIWEAHILRKRTGAKIYCPKQDSFMMESDCFNLGLTPCCADVYIENDKTITTLNVEGIEVKYWHFPGHTPGCSIIEIDHHFFSGDFIFQRSIGRCDFPYSNPKDMKDSLQRFLTISYDFPIHPGHGEDTSVFAEKHSIPKWLKYLDLESSRQQILS